MVRASSCLASCVLAASLLSSGCQITIKSGSSAAQEPPSPPRPAASASTSKPTKPAPTAQQPRPTPAVLRRPPPSTAPRITTPIAFGGTKFAPFQGLAYVIPENTKELPKLDQLVPFAKLYTDKFDIQSQDFSSGFPGALMQNEWFALRYEGPFTVPSEGLWQFRLTSDDGAILYVDDRRVVVNDGVHTAKSAEGEAQLAAGPHYLRLEYFQAAKGQVALTLLIGKKGKLEPLVGAR